MKGIVFTEFLDFVGATMGGNMVDDIIDDCNFPHGGSYTRVGTYDYQEIVQLAVALSKRTNVAIPDLLTAFGQHLCGRFSELYPEFFDAKDNLFDFLDSVDGHIHVEVRKLYPDAALPSFTTRERTGKSLELDYQSRCPFAPLAEGMIKGAAQHYRQPVNLTYRPIEPEGAGAFRFSIRHDDEC